MFSGKKELFSPKNMIVPKGEKKELKFLAWDLGKNQLPLVMMNFF
jgi:hypothetical protein